MIVDDFCVVQLSLELGPWQSMRNAYETWTGAYSGMLLKGVINQLDTNMPRVAPALIVVLWLAGAYLFGRRLLAWSSRCKLDRTVTLAAAALCVGACINSFYTPQAFYWAAASIQYALPIAILAWYFALAIWLIKQDNNGLHWRLMLLLSILICFLTAGMAEMHAAFQSVFFTLLLLSILVLLRGSIRYRATTVVGAGWLATLLGLLIQFTSPGVAIRGSGYGLWIEDPLRDAAMLLSRTNHQVAILLSDSEVLAGFILLMALGLLVTLSCHRTSVYADKLMPIRLNRGPLLLGSALQLIAVPLLWLHMSDHPIVFGRFSASFMVPVTLNAGVHCFVLLRALAAQTHQRDAEAKKREYHDTDRLSSHLTHAAIPVDSVSQHPRACTDLSCIQHSWLAIRAGVAACSIVT